MDFLSLINEDDCSQQPKKSVPLPDYHLRSPLKPLDWIHMDHNRITSRNRLDLNYLRNYVRHFIVGNPIDLISAFNDKIPNQNTESWSKVTGDLLIRMGIDRDILPEETHPDFEGIRDIICLLDNGLWNRMRFWNSVLLVLNALSSSRPVPEGFIMSRGVVKITCLKTTEVIVMRTCIVVRCGRGSGTIYDGDWVRMSSDLHTQRFLIFLTSRLGQKVNQFVYPGVDLISSIISWGDDVLFNFKNEGYKLLKTYEAIVIGVLQARGNDSITNPGAFLGNTLTDILMENPKMHNFAMKLVRILETVSNPHHMTQLYGLHRAWGHPIVDSTKGMDKVIRIGRKDIVMRTDLSEDSGRMFKRLFAKEFKARNGMYPPIYNGHTLLHTKLQEGDSSATDLRVHPLIEWDRVKFKKVFDIPETFNLSMIVADKSISPSRTELVSIIKRKGTVMDAGKRRGVNRWLNDNSLRPKEFLKDINEGKFPEDHQIIGLTPKERELNPTPRMFALMSHLMRVYVVITEQMLSDHVLNMFPQITMTDTLLDLTKKMYVTVKQQSNVGRKTGVKHRWASRVVCMSLDFEKWNGHMRKTMTKPVFTSLGDLFGLSELYNMTYDIFEGSYYYLADGTYIPKVDSSGNLEVTEPYSFTGHKGGMEGLRQKGWTLYTVCCLEVILSKYNCTYKIMGMGDNQVLQITLYTNKIDLRGSPTVEGLSDMKTTLGLIFDDLINSFTLSGLPLKPLETWLSEDLYLYGKTPLWKGVPLSMDMKKLMRTFPWSNADVMTLENALGTISGNASSATQSTSCVWLPYLIGLIMSSLCITDFLSYHPLIGSSLSRRGSELGHWILAMSKLNKKKYRTEMRGLSTDHIRLVIQIMPRTLTGHNGLNLYEFMMRGFPDNLTRDVSYLTAVLKCPSAPKWLKSVIENWLSPIFMPDTNYSTLLQDVTSVNLMSPRAPTAGIKQTVERYMTDERLIKNKEFRDLMATKVKEHEEYLSECLCEGKILHIRLLHDIYEATIYGYVNSILSKVTKTSTIQNLAMAKSSFDVFDVICRDEVNCYNYVIWRSSAKGMQLSLSCPTEFCKEIRLIGWGKDLRGVTTPYPASYLIESNCDVTDSCMCDDGYLSVHFPDDQITNEMWMFDIGGNPPYLGSTTKEKVVIGTGGRVYSSEPLVKRPINLLRTINWFVPPDSNAARLILSTVSAVTDLDPHPYQGILEGTAGSEIHRYRDSCTSHGTLTSSCFLFSTRYHLSTDQLTRYSKGAENTDIHYQAVFSWMVELCNMYVTNRIRGGDVVTKFKHYKQSCYRCINPIPEDFIDIPSGKAADTVPSQKDNPYLYASKATIRISEKISPLFVMSPREFSYDQYQSMTNMQRLVWLHDIIADRIVSDVVSNSSDDTAVSIGLHDVRSYERTMYLKLNPKYLINKVLSRLLIVAEWGVIKSGHVGLSMDDDIKRTLINILENANPTSFLGLGMFYCWEESSSRMDVYPEMIRPNTNPISSASACEAMQKNMIGLSLGRKWKDSNRIAILADEEKYNFVIVKMFLYNYLKSHSQCNLCRRLTSSLQIGDVRYLRTLTCDRGHVVFDRMIKVPYSASNVTVERLRKDVSNTMRANRSRARITNPMKGQYSIEMVSSTQMGRQYSSVRDQDNGILEYDYPQDYHRYSIYQLIMLTQLPTNTRYKYSDILARVGKRIVNSNVFCLGDGLGSTSSLLWELGASKIICSTLLTPDDAIPQTYVHNVPPMLSDLGDDVDFKHMINLPNNILDSRWHDSWKSVVSNCDMVLCDVEILGRNKAKERLILMEKILRINNWRTAVIKDYLFSPDDMCNQIRRIASSQPKGWSLVTSKFRSAHHPEVWWLIDRSREVTGSISVGPFVGNVLSTWWTVRRELMESYNDDILTSTDMKTLAFINSGHNARRMETYVRSWLIFPVIGSMLPQKGSFTQLFYYLKKTKRPGKIHTVRGNSNLRLYSSDFSDLRIKMFALAVSMLADINDRLTMIKESSEWDLVWYEDKYKDWRPKLTRSLDNQLPRCEVINYVPMLSSIMLREGLIFRSHTDDVMFRPDRKREELCFPISVVADKNKVAYYPVVRQ
ncbi:RNA-dependent RNA polymerase [Wuhan Insect virus 6]|uniref:Replicase n=1 Tax=Wuhan Insect virus 6 TaxID=1608111 RepID=A0A0B5KRQ6_9RHAB|nr:RNA-dependent RNA polymerase [Wuhan Insect virus 6]AJG39191.1 RNA-dependent RNA polymerase [Wuhan Insect virus 6]